MSQMAFGFFIVGAILLAPLAACVRRSLQLLQGNREGESDLLEQKVATVYGHTLTTEERRSSSSLHTCVNIVSHAVFSVFVFAMTIPPSRYAGPTPTPATSRRQWSEESLYDRKQLIRLHYDSGGAAGCPWCDINEVRSNRRRRLPAFIYLFVAANATCARLRPGCLAT